MSMSHFCSCTCYSHYLPDTYSLRQQWGVYPGLEDYDINEDKTFITKNTGSRKGDTEKNLQSRTRNNET